MAMRFSAISKRFPLGSVVRLSAEGRKLYSSKLKQERNGIVRGYARDGICVRICWDDRPSTDKYHRDFLKRAPQGRAVEPDR